jgi:hypothetical protein
MRDGLTRRGVNTGGKCTTGIKKFNGQVARRFNVNIKALDVLYKPMNIKPLMSFISP